MYAIDIQDVGNIKKLNVPINKIQVEVGRFTLIIFDNMAFWRGANPTVQNDELERYTFFGRDRITQAIDHYNKIMGAYKREG